MPNAAKLVAALGLALLGGVLSVMVMGLFDEDTNFGWFVQVNVALGLAVGWTTIGRRAGRGMVTAANVGFTGAILLVLWGLFLQSLYKMFERSMLGRIDNMSEAIMDTLETMIEWALMMSTVPIWGTVVIGGIVVGLCSEMAWRRWR